MKNRKKLIVLSTFGALALLFLVLVFFAFIFQNIAMINLLFKSPEIIANNNDLAKNMHAKKQLEPSVAKRENQILFTEQENHKDILTFDSRKKNDQRKNNSEIIIESDKTNPDPLENHSDLQANRDILLHQLEKFLASGYYSEQLVNIVNQLAWIGDSNALAALIDGYQKTKFDGDSSSEILNAISKVANPEVVDDLGDYMNEAMDDEDDALLASVATALSNIGSEEATDLLIQTVSTTPAEDNTNSIISNAIANIRNSDVAPILANMIEEKVDGYEGAMEALLKLGDFGIEKITKLLTQDENIEYREKLLSVTETMPFDEETYHSLNKLANLNEEFEDFFVDAADSLQDDMVDLQGQALDLKTQKTSIETQHGQFESRNEELATGLEELDGAKERVAEPEGAAPMEGQPHTILSKELDQEKQNRMPLRPDLSTKADLVAALQQKLEATLSSRAKLEKDIEKSKNQIRELQGQLLDLKAQKASFDTQLGKFKSLNEELAANQEKLEGMQERVAALGKLATMGGQKLTDLSKELDHEKRKTKLLRTELSTKADLVAGLHQKLEASLASQIELENAIKKNEKVVGELQNQLLEFKAQPDPTESSAVIVDVGKKSTSKSESSSERGESPSPYHVIDWVLKKKSR